MTTVAPNLAYREALDFLSSRIDYERALAMPYNVRELRLDRMRRLLDQLGNPQNGLKIVHIAGTKGKGSTAAMIASMLTEAGYRTGLYTSPHLDRVEQRMAVDALPCTAEELSGLVQHVRPVVRLMDSQSHSDDDNRPTYFEIITALALLHFAQRRVDFAVLEVGMGGRLDSTNVCQPMVTVITSISLDHTQQLGRTVAAIAREKAGIIKRGVRVVSGVKAADARAVIGDVARHQGSPLIELGAGFDVAYRPAQYLEARDEFGRIDFRYHADGRQWKLRDAELGLVGAHQADNAAVALATIAELQRQDVAVPEAALRDGLARVRLPARVEVVGRHPTVVLDAAHNVASIEAFLQTLQESFYATSRVLVFATTRDKDVREMLDRLLPKFDYVVFTRYIHNPRGVPPEEMAATAAELAANLKTTPNVSIAPNPEAAWHMVAALADRDDLVGITGSFFLAAEIRPVIQAQPLCKSPASAAKR